MDISIVTPVFNSVRWIELCLQSVRHALKERNYEHIVVDGGSTDGTLEYLKQQQDIFSQAALLASRSIWQFLPKT